MTPRILGLAALIALLGTGCGAGDGAGGEDPGSGGKADDPDSSGSADIELPDDIHWVRNSAEYRAAVLQTYRLAGATLAARVADVADPWAVVLDIDETTLSNSEYDRERALAGLEYSSSSFASWVKRRESTAMPGVVAFLTGARDLGGKIVLVTNRTTTQCADTRTNLEMEEIPFDLVLCKTTSSEKESRWSSVEAGTAAPELPPLVIEMFVGDQISDFPDLDQDLRFEPDEAFAGFGARDILLPNPMYGDWTKNARD